jgi:hypothetical protein
MPLLYKNKFTALGIRLSFLQKINLSLFSSWNCFVAQSFQALFQQFL